jgi:hypothetical protein
MHPCLPELVQVLRSYRDKHSPYTVIEVVTNGFGRGFVETLAMLGSDIKVINTAKTSKFNTFLAFNIAPRDLFSYGMADYSCGCWVPEYCGINFSPYGYYCCGAGAGIDRVFGFNIGRKTLPEEADTMRDQMDILCGYCVHFKATKRGKIIREQISLSWQKALDKYKICKPNVTIY